MFPWKLYDAAAPQPATQQPENAIFLDKNHKNRVFELVGKGQTGKALYFLKKAGVTTIDGFLKQVEVFDDLLHHRVIQFREWRMLTAGVNAALINCFPDANPQITADQHLENELKQSVEEFLKQGKIAAAIQCCFDLHTDFVLISANFHMAENAFKNGQIDQKIMDEQRSLSHYAVKEALHKTLG